MPLDPVSNRIGWFILRVPSERIFIYNIRIWDGFPGYSNFINGTVIGASSSAFADKEINENESKITDKRSRADPAPGQKLLIKFAPSPGPTTRSIHPDLTCKCRKRRLQSKMYVLLA
jgi:hypothetical protein